MPENSCAGLQDILLLLCRYCCSCWLLECKALTKNFPCIILINLREHTALNAIIPILGNREEYWQTCSIGCSANVMPLGASLGCFPSTALPHPNPCHNLSLMVDFVHLTGVRITMETLLGVSMRHQKSLAKEGRLFLNVGSIIPWDGIPDCTKGEHKLNVSILPPAAF